MVLTASGLSSSPRTSLLERRSLAFDSSLTPIQQQVDGLVEGFVREATRPTTLAAMMAGSTAYRFARIGVMGLPMGASASIPLQGLSYGVGLGAVVTAFEGANRFLSSVTGESSNPHLWSWNGEGGWRQGLVSSALTFGTLRGAGFLAREQNLIFQHFLQSTAMVAGHQLVARAGIAERPEGGLAEQFLHAGRPTFSSLRGWAFEQHGSRCHACGGEPGIVFKSQREKLRSREENLFPLSP